MRIQSLTPGVDTGIGHLPSPGHEAISALWLELALIAADPLA